jgi:hypothetical protein
MPPVVAAVPAVGDAVPAAEDDVPASLVVPPIGSTVEPPEVVPFPAVDELVPPPPSSGVSALEQPETAANTRNPTDAMPAYTLIMETSLFETRVHEVRRRPSP